MPIDKEKILARIRQDAAASEASLNRPFDLESRKTDLRVSIDVIKAESEARSSGVRASDIYKAITDGAKRGRNLVRQNIARKG